MSDSEKTERLQSLQIVSDQVGGIYQPEQIGVIQKNVAKGTTMNELAYFLNVCKTNGMNPFNKEIWCYKDHKKNLVIFTGRDGFLKKAQEHENYGGMRSSEVRKNDEFEADIPNGLIHHKVSSFGDRGEIVGAYAFVFRLSGEATVELVKFSEYNKGYSVWKTHPAEMIKKVAESKALKKAFGLLPNVQSEYDFDVKGEVVVPNNKVSDDEKLDRLKTIFAAKKGTFTDDERSGIERIIDQKEVNGYDKAIKFLIKKYTE